MKKCLIALLAGALLCFAGCTGNGKQPEKTTETESETVTTPEPAGTSDDYTKRY